MHTIQSIVKLSVKFYEKYPNEKYPELLNKVERPYNCLAFQCGIFYICIPFRTHIPHSNAFLFKSTARSRLNKSGLDYSKIVILDNRSYVSKEKATVDLDEYKQTVLYKEIIEYEAINYIRSYLNHIDGIKILSKGAYDKKYKFTSLKYFIKEIHSNDFLEFLKISIS